MHFNVFGAFLLISFPAIASAQEWISYADSPQGDKGFLDRSSLKVEGNTRTVWTLLEKASPATFKGQPLQNWMSLVEVDCTGRMHRSLQEVGYRPDGSVLYEARMRGDGRPVVPQTMGEIRLETICNLQ